MHKDTRISEALHNHLEAAIEQFGKERVVGVYLYGSQNYNLDTENSDVDSKCIILPTWEDITFQKKWTSKELHIGDEHCEVKDIREMVNMWKKSNMNFLEIFVTDYCQMNWALPTHSFNFSNMAMTMLRKRADDIAYYDLQKTYSSILGQAMGTYRGETITPKKVMTLARLTNALTKMSQRVSYKNVVKCNDEEREEFLKLKDSLENKEQVVLKQNALSYIQKMQELEPYFKDCPKTDIYETYVNKIIVNMIKYNLQTGNEAY